MQSTSTYKNGEHECDILMDEDRLHSVSIHHVTSMTQTTKHRVKEDGLTYTLTTLTVTDSDGKTFDINLFMEKDA